MKIAQKLSFSATIAELANSVMLRVTTADENPQIFLMKIFRFPYKIGFGNRIKILAICMVNTAPRAQRTMSRRSGGPLELDFFYTN